MVLAGVTGQQFESLKAELQGQGAATLPCLPKNGKAKVLMKVVIVSLWVQRNAHRRIKKQGLCSSQSAKTSSEQYFRSGEYVLNIPTLVVMAVLGNPIKLNRCLVNFG